MFQDGSVNNKIRNIHERALTIANNDICSNFEDLLCMYGMYVWYVYFCHKIKLQLMIKKKANQFTDVQNLLAKAK